MNQTETAESPNVDYMRKLHRWRMAFFGLVILLAGLVIGISSTLMVVRHGERVHPWGPGFPSGTIIMRDLQRYLDLSPEQVKKIEAIVKKRMQKLEQLREEARPKVAEQLKLMNEEISAVLTEEQRRDWQQNWKREFHRFQRPPRPGGPRPGEGPRHRGGPPDRIRRDPQGIGPPPDPNRPTVRPQEYEPRYNGRDKQIVNEQF
jgi:Spy/CpxP family protein refolding chaperone